MKVRCNTTIYDNMTFGDIYQVLIYDVRYTIKADDDIIDSFAACCFTEIKEEPMKVKCINKGNNANIAINYIYDVYQTFKNQYKILNDVGYYFNYPQELFEVVSDPILTPLQYWAQLNGLEEGDVFSFESNTRITTNIIYSEKCIQSLDGDNLKETIVEMMLGIGVVNKHPKTRTITIDEKKITISEESYQSLKKALVEGE
jgi:hypothetical protein